VEEEVGGEEGEEDQQTVADQKDLPGRPLHRAAS
jgi:hypothetical protein